MDRAERMGTDRMGSLVARLSLPVIVGMVAGSLYHLADRVFVGRGVGEAAWLYQHGRNQPRVGH